MIGQPGTILKTILDLYLAASAATLDTPYQLQSSTFGARLKSLTDQELRLLLTRIWDLAQKGHINVYRCFTSDQIFIESGNSKQINLTLVAMSFRQVILEITMTSGSLVVSMVIFWPQGPGFVSCYFFL